MLASSCSCDPFLTRMPAPLSTLVTSPWYQPPYASHQLRAGQKEGCNQGRGARVSFIESRVRAAARRGARRLPRRPWRASGMGPTVRRMKCSSKRACAQGVCPRQAQAASPALGTHTLTRQPMPSSRAVARSGCGRTRRPGREASASTSMLCAAYACAAGRGWPRGPLPLSRRRLTAPLPPLPGGGTSARWAHFRLRDTAAMLCRYVGVRGGPEQRRAGEMVAGRARASP